MKAYSYLKIRGVASTKAQEPRCKEDDTYSDDT
jgi:hypothetical protein